MIIPREDYLSNEGVNQSKLKLIAIPSLYKNYTPKEEDDEDSDPDHFKKGTFIDDILYNSTTIWDKYIVSTVKIPTASLLELAHKAAKRDCIVPEQVEEISKELQLWSNTKDEKKRIEKFNNTEFWDYIKFLKEAKGKIILSQEEYDVMMYNYDNLSGIFQGMRMKDCLTAEYKGIKLKGELDFLNIKEYTWKVEDLKSTQDLNNFSYSILKYRYEFQMAFYEFLVEHNTDAVGISSKHMKERGMWRVISNRLSLPTFSILNPWDAWFSFVEGNRYYMGVQEALERLLWHLEHDKWDYPREYYEKGYIIPYCNPRYILEESVNNNKNQLKLF